MRNAILFLLIVVIILTANSVTSVNTFTCMQENTNNTLPWCANQTLGSATCTNIINCNNVVDGNYSGDSGSYGTGLTREVYLNYSMPPGVVNVTWQTVADYDSLSYVNNSPLAGCFYKSPISLRWDTAPSRNDRYCLNQSNGYISLGYNAGGYKDWLIEEAAFWNLTVPQVYNDTACSATVATIVTYSEESPTSAITQNLSISLIYNSNTPPKDVFNDTLTLSSSNSYTLCLNTSRVYPTNYSLIGYLTHQTSPGRINKHYINQTIGTSTGPLTLTLYGITDTTNYDEIRIVLRYKNSYAYFPNVITRLQRYYPAENVWRVVQEDKSDDFGQVVFSVKTDGTDYKLVFYNDASTLLTSSSSMRFYCPSGTCSDLIYLLSDTSTSTTYTILGVTTTHNNSTRNLSTSWADNTGSTRTVVQEIYRYNMTGMTLVSNQSQIGSSGIFAYNTSGQTGSLLVKTLVDGRVKSTEFISLPQTTLGQLLTGKDGSVWAFAIVLTASMAGLVSPTAAIIMTTVGLLVISLLGMVPAITYPFLIIVAILGGIVAMRVKS